MMKLNNKGQVLVLFVVMFPIILFLVCFFADSMVITTEKNKLNNIGEIAISYIYENKDDTDIYNKTLNLIRENDKDVHISNYNISNDKIELKINKQANSIFGRIVGIKTYEIVSEYQGVFDDVNVTYSRK